MIKKIINMRNEDGFTLIELLIAVASVVLVAGAIVLVYQTGNKSYLVGAARIDMQQTARVVMDRMISEIRHAHEVTVSNSNSVTIKTNQYSTDQVRSYHLDTANKILRLDEGNNTNQELATGVSSLSFVYYDKNGNITTTPTDVRKIKITITVETEGNTGTEYFRNMSLSSDVKLRNIFF